MVKVYLAVKRRLQPGDKMAGRHGNKGVVSPHRPDRRHAVHRRWYAGGYRAEPAGRTVAYEHRPDSRSALGWAAGLGNKIDRMLKAQQGVRLAKCVRSWRRFTTRRPEGRHRFIQRWRRIVELARNLSKGVPFATPVFDGAERKKSRRCWNWAICRASGQITLLMAAPAKRSTVKVTVGYMYMLKLHHLVDDKMHARSTGPYSLVTQQPLGGKGAVRWSALPVKWSLGAGGLRRVLHAAGNADR